MNRLMRSLRMCIIAVMMLLLVTACNSVESDSKKPAPNKSSEKPAESESKPASQDQTSVEMQLKQVVEDNLQAMNEENMLKYMAMISEQTPSDIRTQTEETMKYAFKNFDLQATVKNFKVVSVSGETAVVEVEQDTVSKNNDPRFKNNRTVAEHTLVKEDNQWKFKASVIKSTTELKSGM